MDNFSLSTQSPLGGYGITIGEISLREVLGLNIYSIAKPMNDDRTFNSSFKSMFANEPPISPHTLISKSPECRILPTQSDQWFVIGETDQLTNTFSTTTDQSDAWVCLEISGENILLALERICPINLHPDQFPIGYGARTVMHHIGCIIIHTEKNHYWLLSARSSAESFLHTVKTAIEHGT